MNNPAPDPANEGGGSPPLLSQLYDTLGAVQGGLDARQQEVEEDKKRLLEQEKALVQERDAAAEADDAEAFAAATKQLEELWEAWGVLTDGDEEPDAQSESEDSHGEGDERRGDGDDRGAGQLGSPLPGAAGGGELQRGAGGAGPPDDQQ